MCQNSLPSGVGRSLGAKISGGRGRVTDGRTDRQSIAARCKNRIGSRVYCNFVYMVFGIFLLPVLTLALVARRLSPFWRPLQVTVRPILRDHCPQCRVCNVGVLWPNVWMDQEATWYGGRRRPRRCCVR